MHHSLNQRQSIVVIGAGGHAKVVADALRINGYSITGFVDDVSLDRQGQIFCGAAIIGSIDQAAELFPPESTLAIIAFGANTPRLDKARKASSVGYRFPLVIHPRGCVAADTELGEGTVILANASVGPGSGLGAHVIVNTGASIDHDCVVGDGAHIGPGSVIAGHATIGKRSFVGAGAVIIDHVTVGQECVIGAGAVVTKDVKDGLTVAGVPAKPMCRSD